MEEKQTITNEPKKHHYIPQFILKRFYNEKNQVLYWDIDKKTVEGRNTTKIFMNMHMYRDEKNNADDPTAIEKSFSVFEERIAKLISEKMLDEKEIRLTRAELEELRIFLELLSFRSDLRMKQYKEKRFDPKTREILRKFQPNEDYEDLWKKELLALTKCRSLDDIKGCEALDPIVKMDFTNAINFFYMNVVDARGGEFILSDVYPTSEIAPLPKGNLHLHLFFPISPTRAIVLHYSIFKKEMNHQDPVIKALLDLSQIKGDLLRQPTPEYKGGKCNFERDDIFVYHPTKAYANDVSYINALLLNEARIGIMFRSPNRILGSVRSFNEREDTKTKYPEFEKELQKLCDLQSSGADSKI